MLLCNADGTVGLVFKTISVLVVPHKSQGAVIFILFL